MAVFGDLGANFFGIVRDKASNITWRYATQNNVSAVQGHPRSLILVPIESAYATSY